jgi:ABC-type thiamine transport system ATPase subunit
MSAASDVRVQEVGVLCTGAAAQAAAFVEQASALPDAALAALLAAFRYLKSLGLEVWNEEGLRLRPVSEPGHMCLSSNALAQLRVLEGAGLARGPGLRLCWSRGTLAHFVKRNAQLSAGNISQKSTGTLPAFRVSS